MDDGGSGLGNRATRKRRKMQRVTMMDVAKHAQVSPSTVSLYLRKPESVSPAAGQEIARAVSTLGYVPNLVAGGLAAASSKVVSIIVPSIRNAFFAETVSTLQAELRAEGLQVLLGHSEYAEAEEEALIRTALSWSPAAVVLTGLTHSPDARKLLKASGIPVIEMWELGGEPIDMAVGFSHPEVGASAAYPQDLGYLPQARTAAPPSAPAASRRRAEPPGLNHARSSTIRAQRAWKPARCC